MSAKQKEIFKWLEEIYGENQIPKFEKNATNIEIIYNIMLSYKEALEDLEFANSLKVSALCKIEKYVHEKQKILQALDFPNFLQPPEKKILDVMCNLCNELNLESPSSTNINIGIHSLEEQNDEINSLLVKEKLRTKKLLKLSENTAKNLDELKNISEHGEKTALLKENEVKTEETRSQFCQKKLEQYTSEIHQLESKLASVGFEEAISHPVLASKMKELTELEKQYEDAKCTLDSYTLPPDMTIAMVEVEKSRQQLSLCMQQIAQNYEKPS